MYGFDRFKTLSKLIILLLIYCSFTMMEGFNLPAEAIAEAVAKIETTNQYGLGNLLKSFAFGMIFQIIIGLIVAAIMKKNKTDGE